VSPGAEKTGKRRKSGVDLLSAARDATVYPSIRAGHIMKKLYARDLYYNPSCIPTETKTMKMKIF
jgi:hypothetical protein